VLFSSLTFLFVFLPTIIIVYYLAPLKWRNPILLFSSLLFYAWGGVSYTVVLILSIIFNFIVVKKINSTPQKVWLQIGLLGNIVILLIFKYLDFFILNFNTLLAIIPNTTPLPSINLLLPLGISFFTFQQMSMLWDVYRDEKKHKITLLNTALYIGFFPQLIAGPIVRYHDIIDQIKHRSESAELFFSGVKKFVLGLFKKVILANQMALLADTVINEEYRFLASSAAWLGITAYSLQIYFDFSGYSDMAIGLARMFGFKIFENFNFPYISTSIKDFWGRWHISLSTWFRDYVYIPLGGNQRSTTQTYANLIIVFLLTGFWHGATWSFVFWGAFHGVFLIIEKLGMDALLQKIPRPISWFYTLIVVMIGWVFFRIENFSEAVQFVKLLFSFNTTHPLSALKFLNRENLLVLVLAILASTPMFKIINDYVSSTKNNTAIIIVEILKSIGILISIVYIAMVLNAGSYNPFIYFRF
jgi:alginate O-acetyltransferase complex protein AlgI